MMEGYDTNAADARSQWNPGELRPSTQKSWLPDHAPVKARNYPRDQLTRPQTLCAHMRPGEVADPGQNEHQKLRPAPKNIRVIFGAQNQRLKPYVVPRVLPDHAYLAGGDRAEGLATRGRMTADYFFSRLPKLRPETHGLPEGEKKQAQIRASPPGWKGRWDTFYGSMAKEQGPAPTKPAAAGMRPNTGITLGEHKPAGAPPQTAAAKSRVDRVMRMSTPQTKSECRPDSRYNKATLCLKLNNGREKSPDYRVPVVDMGLYENMSRQAIMPECWK